MSHTAQGVGSKEKETGTCNFPAERIQRLEETEDALRNPGELHSTASPSDSLDLCKKRVIFSCSKNYLK